MHILSFDTSTPVLHLALLDGRQPLVSKLVEPTSHNRQEVASLLIPEIDRAFGEAGWSKHELSLIVVGTGPGSFTGIRVGVITARSLAQALNLPLAGVSLLESLAYLLEPPVGIILSSTAGHYFAGAFCAGKINPVEPVLEPCYVSQAELAGKREAVSTWSADEDACLSLPAFSCQRLPTIKNIAVAQAQLTVDRLSLKGSYTENLDRDPALLEELPWWNVLPRYLRSPSVTIKKNYGNTNPTHDAS